VRRTPLERLEELATDVLGQGAAISVTPRPGGVCVTAWDKCGDARASSGLYRTQREAIAECRRRLELPVAKHLASGDAHRIYGAGRTCAP
jgi:hypothetical protein